MLALSRLLLQVDCYICAFLLFRMPPLKKLKINLNQLAVTPNPPQTHRVPIFGSFIARCFPPLLSNPTQLMSDHNNKNNSNTNCIAVHHSDLGIHLMEGHHKPITVGTCEMEMKKQTFINILSLSIYAGTAAGATQVFVAHSLNVSQPGRARFINLCHFQPFWP